MPYALPRVQQIRDVIVEAGGNPTFTYYCDGPYSGMGPSKGKGGVGVSYKIEGYSDGFKTREQREKAVELLKALPGVTAAYVTRPAATRTWRILNREGNIKVFFDSRAR